MKKEEKKEYLLLSEGAVWIGIIGGIIVLPFSIKSLIADIGNKADTSLIVLRAIFVLILISAIVQCYCQHRRYCKLRKELKEQNGRE